MKTILILVMLIIVNKNENFTAENKSLITICFDDGWVSQYDTALPILNKYGFKATFYIITRHLSDQNHNYMSKEQVLSLSKNGFEIGSHSVNHPNFLFTFPWNGYEIYKSKKDLEAIGIQIKSFAYPYGRDNFIVQKMVEKAGYSNARIVNNDFNSQNTINKWRIRAKYVRRTTSVLEVQSWIKEAREKGYWLVLVFHQVQSNPYAFGCTRQIFDNVCKSIVDSKVKVLPLTDALAFYK